MQVVVRSSYSGMSRSLVRGGAFALAAIFALNAVAQEPQPPRDDRPNRQGPDGQNRGGQNRDGQRPGGPGGGRGFGGPGGGFGGGPGGGGELMLLANEQVQKELELIDEQIKDFEKLREEQRTKMTEMFSGMRDLPEDERRAKFEEMRGKLEATQKELKTKMTEVLMPHQQDRLRELFVQIRGAGALDDPDVAADLKITEDQKKKLAETREQVGQQMRDSFASFRDLSEEERRAKFQQMQTETTDKILAVLSSEQRAQFEQMKGEKFEFDRSQFGFGGRGPGGPGGGPGGPGGFQGRRPGGDRPQGDRPQNDRPEGDRAERERPSND